MAVIGAPQQGVMSNLGGDLFNGVPKLFIKQEMAMVELCGIEAKQRYRISQATADNKESDVFLYISEESGCAERICCGPNRSLTLKVHQGNSKEGPVVQTMQKPFTLQGCCCLRPSFDVKAGASQVGFVEDPCRCCWMDQQVKDAGGNLLFITSGSVCQCGMCCPCCFGISFVTKKGDNRIGGIEKLPMDCAELCVQTNRFVIDMESVRDPVERRMMLASAMLLDLAYFEQQK